MHWHSVDDFLAMGGYALYVWGSFGACALAMAAETFLVRRRHASSAAALRRRHAAAAGAPGDAT
jgi:heme exporter protein D